MIAFPALRNPVAVRNLAEFAGASAIALVSVAGALHVAPHLHDARVYWEAWQGPLYAGAFVYPPPAGLLFAPAAILPWPAFAAVWLGVLAVAGAWLLWPLPLHLRVPFFVALSATFAWANAATVIAVALALAPRWPVLWAAVAWTKVTPVVAAASLLRQRRWRDLAVAVGACAGVGLVVLILAPGSLGEWLSQLARHPEIPSYYLAMLAWVPPFWIRLPVAAAIAAWGGSRWWTILVAAALATPDLSIATCGILAAAPRLMGLGPADALRPGQAN